MTDRVSARLEAHHGVLSSADLKDLGVTERELGRLLRDRVLVRVRRCAFVDGALYEGTGRENRYRLQVLAVLRSRPGDAAARHAALAIHRLPLFGCDLGRIDLLGPVSTVRVASPLVIHPTDGARLTSHEGIACQTLAEALVRVAATAGTEAALVAADAALARRLVTRPQLMRAAVWARGRPGCDSVRQMVGLLDESSESPGESRTRLLLHDAAFRVTSQVPIPDECGAVFARVDFLVEDRVVVEFDGALKYGPQQPGALFAEKRREDRLREQGYEVVRVVWDDLDDPRRVVQRVRAAVERSHAPRTARLTRRPDKPSGPQARPSI